jgi:hypothetical protein
LAGTVEEKGVNPLGLSPPMVRWGGSVALRMRKIEKKIPLSAKKHRKRNFCEVHSDTIPLT